MPSINHPFWNFKFSMSALSTAWTLSDISLAICSSFAAICLSHVLSNGRCISNPWRGNSQSPVVTACVYAANIRAHVKLDYKRTMPTPDIEQWPAPCQIIDTSAGVSPVSNVWVPYHLPVVSFFSDFFFYSSKEFSDISCLY